MLIFSANAARCDASQGRVYTFVDDDGVIHVTNVARTLLARREPQRTPPRVSAHRFRSEPGSSARTIAYDDLVDETARTYGVDAALVHALIRVESNYDASAVSPKGAVGLMQLMPATARRFGVEDPRNVAQNVQGGISYLRFLLDTFHHDLTLVLAAYNAGEAAVAKYGGIPPYVETKNYVAKVLRHYLQPTFDPSRSITAVADSRAAD